MNSIETVFEWLLSATLRASALAVVILCIQYVLRRRLPAAWQYALWLPMLAVLVLPVLPEAPFGLVSHQAAEPTAAVVAPMSMTSGFAALETSSEGTAPAPGLAAKLNYFAIAWLAGACVVLAAGAFGYQRNMRRIRLSSSAPDRRLQAAIEEAAEKVGLKRVPQVLISPDVASPAVTGLVRPALLLPAGFPDGFSGVEARLILLHEFTHLKRLDLPLNWLMFVLQALHWFNPLLWFAFARMRADREAACDARVLSIDATDRRAEYGGALLKLQCTAPSRSMSLSFVGIFERGSGIKSRIQGISNYRPGRFAWKAAGGAILTLLMVFGVTQGQQPDPAADAKEKTVEVDPDATQNNSGKERIQQQLNSIIIPSINFNNASIEDAIRFLSQQSKTLDTSEPDPNKRGVNFILRLPSPAAGETADSPKITLRLQNVPLSVVLQNICDAVNLSYTVDDFAVTIAPREKVGVNPAVPKDNVAREQIQKKLNQIIIPNIDLKNVSVKDAIDFLRERSRALDTTEPDPNKRGVNVILRLPSPPEEAPRITLALQNVPLSMVLQYISDGANLSYTVGDFAVTIAPKNE